MIVKLLRDDTRGVVIVEFSVTIAFFLLLTFGLIQAGLLLWTKSAMQHGVEVAARCASVNYSANQLNLPASCFTDSIVELDFTTGKPVKDTNGKTIPVKPSDVIADTTNTYIAQYAAKHSYGLVAASSFFTVTPPPVGGGGGCPPNVGYQVTATYTYNVLKYIFPAVTLNATSKFPINCS